MQQPILCLRIPLLLLLLIVIIGTLAFPHWSGDELRLMPYEWVLLLTITISAVVGTISRKSLTRRDVVEFILWNITMLVLAALLFLNLLNIILIWSFLIGVRVIVIGAWVFVIVAGILLFLRLRKWGRQTRVQRGRLGLLGKWWFSTALTLCLLEVSFVVLEHLQLNARSISHHRELELPQDLPPPSPGEWHLAAIGGSTMLGWPYHPHVSIPKLAVRSLTQHSLNRAEPSGAGSANPSHIVVHNLAVAGVNFPQAVRELNSLQYRPHCLLVYSGHNEFYHELEELGFQVSVPKFALDRLWKYSPTIRVLDQTIVTHFSFFLKSTRLHRELIDRPLGSQEFLTERLNRFESRLEELAQYCQQNEIETVWFIPAAAEVGFEPNRSVLPDNVSTKQKQRLTQLYERAREAERQGNLSVATDLYRSGTENFPGFAEFHYRYGLCLIKLGEFTKAQRHLALALELDAYPVRLQAPYRQALRKVAKQYGIKTIDADSQLRPHTPHGILDESVFLDDVHPTLKGISILADATARVIAADYAKFFDLPAAELVPVSVQEMISSMDLTAEPLANSYERLAAGLELRRPWRFDSEFRQQEANRFREIAEKLRTGKLTPSDVE